MSKYFLLKKQEWSWDKLKNEAKEKIYLFKAKKNVQANALLMNVLAERKKDNGSCKKK